MVRKFIIVGLVLISFLGGMVRFYPDIAARVLLGVYHWSAGLEQKQIETEFGDVSYLEGGQGTPIVFLHGVFARKEHWINMVRHMEQGNRVILLDLPGFGENNMLPISSYKYGAQVDHVKSVLNGLQLATFHIVGSSMGAQIATEIARDWPDRVISLALIGSPTGVDTPQKTPFQQQRLANQANLVVTDRASYDVRNALLFPQKPYVPWAVEYVWFQSEISRAAHNQQVWDVIQNSNVAPIQNIAPQLNQPVLVLWCDTDQIYHSSGLAVLLDQFPNASGHLMQNCGHVPMLDQSKQTAQLYDQFKSNL